MFCRSAGIATVCAQVASAFLLPGSLTPEAESQAAALSLIEPQSKHQFVTLPCSACVFSPRQLQLEEVESDEPLFWIQGGANSVAINFTISRDERELEVNGRSIYPNGFRVGDLFNQPSIYVNQVSSSASLEDIESGHVKTMPLKVTGQGVITAEKTVVSDEGHTLIPITYNIFQLEDQPMVLDAVTVHLLQTKIGELSIMHVEVVNGPSPGLKDLLLPGPLSENYSDQPSAGRLDGPEGHDRHGSHPEHHGHRGHHGQHRHGSRPHGGLHKECKMLPTAICKLKNMLEAKIMGPKKGGCPGRKGRHGRPHQGGQPADYIKPHFRHHGDDGHGHPHHHGRPHHMRPHGGHRQPGHHHHHHAHHRHHESHRNRHFIRAFSHGLAAVLVPTMAGVAVGMTVSLFGLLIGRLIGFLWIRLYRGGRRGSASITLDDESISSIDVNEPLLAEEDAEKRAQIDTPPMYENAPSYAEATKETE